VSGCLNPVVLQVVLNVNSTDSTASGPNQEVTLSNYPNPFNPSTECIFSLPATSHVTLKVYDLLGREVVTLVDETRVAGAHRVTWYGQTANGTAAASGVYLYRIEADGVSLTRKMLLLK
jgi:flagellar hook assembly protein FlgD